MLLEVGEAFNMFVQMMNNNYHWSRGWDLNPCIAALQAAA